MAVIYPNILMPGSEGSSQTTCLNIGAIADSDVQWLIGETFHLDDVISAAATQAGVYVLDERYALRGHELCSGTPWVNGLLTPPVTDVSKAFHPNAAGHARMAADLGQFLDGTATVTQQRPDWEKPLPGVPTRDQALNLLSLLQIATPSTSTYPGNDGFGTWRRTKDSCNVRTQIVTRDGQQLTFVPDGSGNPTCTIANGTWQSPYDDPTGPSPTSRAIQCRRPRRALPRTSTPGIGYLGPATGWGRGDPPAIASPAQ